MNEKVAFDLHFNSEYTIVRDKYMPALNFNRYFQFVHGKATTIVIELTFDIKLLQVNALNKHTKRIY